MTSYISPAAWNACPDRRYIALLARLVAAWLLFATVLPAAASAKHHPLPSASNLARDAARARETGLVFVFLVSQPDCRYCDQVRAAYLAPLARQKPPRLVLRELELNGSATLRDFAGLATTQREFAARYRIKVTPTVLFLDQQGNALAKPLPGADTAGFYGAYLQDALDKALAAAQANANSP